MPPKEDSFYPEIIKTEGAIHPITQIKELIVKNLNNLGFSCEGPEVGEKFNFDMLNIQESSARQMQHTFMLIQNLFTQNSHFSCSNKRYVKINLQSLLYRVSL